jgi:hypothetical protein
MARLLRVVVVIVAFFLLVSLVIGIGAKETGPIEKAVLAFALLGGAFAVRVLLLRLSPREVR